MIQQFKTRTFVEHLRGTFDPVLLRSIRNYLNSIEDQKQTLGQTEREKTAIGRGETSDALRMDSRWYDVWRNPRLSLLERIRPYTWVVFPVQVRIVRANTHKVPWHQDTGYQKLLGSRAHKQLITCFIPLDEDPANRTTLQFAEDELQPLEHTPLDGFGAGISGNFHNANHYALELGDCLLFGDLAVHRTFTPENATIERRSLEFRLVRPEDSLDIKDYFDIESGFFVRKDGSKREKI